MSQTVEKLVTKRNNVVKRYDKLKQPLRSKRNQGLSLSVEEWAEFDNLDREMNEQLYLIDTQLFRLGYR